MMENEFSSESVKLVGKIRERSPQENLQIGESLYRECDRLNPFSRPRGFVFKARTREAYEAWKISQKNPRLW